MTDKQALLAYRISQAEETLADAKKMLAENLSPRSVINRSYYAMFYALLGLFIVYDITTKTLALSQTVTKDTPFSSHRISLFSYRSNGGPPSPDQPSDVGHLLSALGSGRGGNRS